MGPMEIIAESLGLIAIGLGFLIFQQKTRNRILATKLSADVIWIVHFLLLGATSGMVVSLVGVLRSLTFFILSLKGKSGNRGWLAFFMSIGVGAIILTWKNVYSICSVFSCIFATFGYWQKKPQNTKIMGIFVCITQIIYAIFVGSISVIINELITLASIAIFFFKLYAEKRQAEKASLKSAEN